MKLAPVQLRTPMVDKEGRIAPIWVQWFTRLVDSPMREIKDDSERPSQPVMKKNEFVVLKCTNAAVGKNYLVFYDGTDWEYWESTGTNIFSGSPSDSPSPSPSNSPSKSPSPSPSLSPSPSPSLSPSASESPSESPSVSPSAGP